DWAKGTLEWRQTTTEKRQLDKDTKTRTPVTITEEEDKEEHLNSTQNPTDDDRFISLISSITGEMDDNPWVSAKLISLITDEFEEDDEIWINAKSTTATEI